MKVLRIALAALMSSFIILVPTVALAQTNLSISDGICGGANLLPVGEPDPDCATNETGTTLPEIMTNIINIVSWIVGIVAVLMIIYGGFKYLTSGGNDANVTSAKNTILYAIIGLVIVALAQIIVRFVISRFQNT